uniref:ARAD1D12430p n=1 Tax=Blastobotrys adeninivorans TaxID=409370 RepID=A0A060TF20_BLAAD
MKVVILGGSYAASRAIDIISSLDKDAQVTVVSQSTHSYFNVASPRLLIEPEKLEKVFFSVEQWVTQKLGEGKGKFVHGTVEAVDFGAKELSVGLGDDRATKESIQYDILIIATGTRSTPGFKLNDTHEETADAIRALNQKVTKANSIAVIGGNATGVEVAGELGSLKTKKVTVYTGSSSPLSFLDEKRTNATTEKLTKLGVKVVNEIRSRSITEKDGKWTIEFDDGTSADYDLVIEATGVTPNTSFLDSSVLDDRGYVATDKSFAVKGHEDSVLALGDVLSIGQNTLVDMKYNQLEVFKATVAKLLKKVTQEKLYDPSPSATLAVPISRSGGVGLLNGWGMPNFVVRLVKSRDFMISQAKTNF